MANILQMLSPEMKEILRSQNIWPDQVLYLTRPDLRLDMFALGQRHFEIFLQTEEYFRQLVSKADRKERSAGYNVLPRKFRAVLYESDDTTEPRRLLLSLPQSDIPGLRDLYPMLIWTTDEEQSLMESLGDDIALQAYRDGYMDGMPIVALMTGEVLADEDPREEEKERRRSEAIPEELFAIIDDRTDVGETVQAEMKEKGILPEDLLMIRVGDETMDSLSERRTHGILLRYNDENMDRLYRQADSDSLLDEDTRTPKPFKACLLRDNRGAEKLYRLEAPPKLDPDEPERPLFFPHPSMHEEMEEAIPFLSIMATEDAEYLCSLGLTEEDAYIFIPLRLSETSDDTQDLFQS